MLALECTVFHNSNYVNCYIDPVSNGAVSAAMVCVHVSEYKLMHVPRLFKKMKNLCCT